MIEPTTLSCLDPLTEFAPTRRLLQDARQELDEHLDGIGGVASSVPDPAIGIAKSSTLTIHSLPAFGDPSDPDPGFELYVGPITLAPGHDWSVDSVASTADVAAALAGSPLLTTHPFLSVTLAGSEVTLTANSEAIDVISLVLGPAWGNNVSLSSTAIVGGVTTGSAFLTDSAVSAGSETLAQMDAILHGTSSVSEISLRSGINSAITEAGLARAVSGRLRDVKIADGRVIALQTETEPLSGLVELYAVLRSLPAVREVLGSRQSGAVFILTTRLQDSEILIPNSCGSFTRTDTQEVLVGENLGPASVPDAFRFYAFWVGRVQPTPSSSRLFQAEGFSEDQMAALLLPGSDEHQVVTTLIEGSLESCSSFPDSVLAALLEQGIANPACLAAEEPVTLQHVLSQGDAIDTALAQGDETLALDFIAATGSEALSPESPAPRECALGEQVSLFVDELEGLVSSFTALINQLIERVGKQVQKLRSALLWLQEFALGFPTSALQCIVGIQGLVSATPGGPSTPAIPDLPAFPVDTGQLDTLNQLIEEFADKVLAAQGAIQDAIRVLDQPACTLLAIFDALLGEPVQDQLEPCLSVPVPTLPNAPTLGSLTISAPCLRDILDANRRVVQRGQLVVNLLASSATSMLALAYSLSPSNLAVTSRGQSAVRACDRSHATRISRLVLSWT